MNSGEEKEIRLTEFDYQFADPQIQMVKAAIPYLPAPRQRLVSMLVRFQELRRTMQLFSGGEMTAMGLSRTAPAGASPLEILQAMKPYAGAREQEMIEMLENIQLMMQSIQNPA